MSDPMPAEAGGKTWERIVLTTPWKRIFKSSLQLSVVGVLPYETSWQVMKHDSAS